MYFLVEQDLRYIGIVKADSLEKALKICFPARVVSEEERARFLRYPSVAGARVKHADGLEYKVSPIEPRYPNEWGLTDGSQESSYYLVYFRRKCARYGVVRSFQMGPHDWDGASITLKRGGRNVRSAWHAEGSYAYWEVSTLTGPI